MFNNESVLKSIARRVFPGMGRFSDGVAKLGTWDMYLTTAAKVAWLTVKFGRDLLFQIEVQEGSVKATYALPTVVTLANGEQEYATRWSHTHRWSVHDWADVPRVSIGIRDFFDNNDEFLEMEAAVHKILEGPASIN